MWGIVANIWNQQLQTASRGWFSSLGAEQGRTTPNCKTLSCYEILHRALDLGWIFRMNYSTENGREIWNLECQESA
jgi:hypothetical protein